MNKKYTMVRQPGTMPTVDTRLGRNSEAKPVMPVPIPQPRQTRYQHRRHSCPGRCQSNKGLFASAYVKKSELFQKGCRNNNERKDMGARKSVFFYRKGISAGPIQAEPAALQANPKPAPTARHERRTGVFIGSPWRPSCSGSCSHARRPVLPGPHRIFESKNAAPAVSIADTVRCFVEMTTKNDGPRLLPRPRRFPWFAHTNGNPALRDRQLPLPRYQQKTLSEENTSATSLS